MPNKHSTKPDACTCKICGKRYTRSDALTRHLNANISCKTGTASISAQIPESAPRPQSLELAPVKKRRIEALSTKSAKDIE